MLFKNNSICLYIALLCAATTVSAIEFRINPSLEIQEAVNEGQDGDPEIKRQIREAEKMHDMAEQYDPKLRAMDKSLQLTLDNLNVGMEVVVSKGYPTTIAFFDINGNPWPILVESSGRKDKFSVTKGGGNEQKGSGIEHILTITTGYLAGRTEVAAFFKGLQTSVKIPVRIGVKSYHRDVKITLPLENPDAEPLDLSPVAKQRLVASDTDSVARLLLDNLPVEGADYFSIEKKMFSGVKMPLDGDIAIVINQTIYIKSRLTHVSPIPDTFFTGPNKYYVYKYSKKTRSMSGYSNGGTRVMLILTPGKNKLGMRHFR